jgi:hypothetical protein
LGHILGDFFQTHLVTLATTQLNLNVLIISFTSQWYICMYVYVNVNCYLALKKIYFGHWSQQYSGKLTHITKNTLFLEENSSLCFQSESNTLHSKTEWLTWNKFFTVDRFFFTNNEKNFLSSDVLWKNWTTYNIQQSIKLRMICPSF